MYVILLFCLMILVFFSYDTIHQNIIDDRVYVTAFDGNKYLVRNTREKKDTADALARINERILLFISRLESDNNENTAVVKRLRNRYRPDTLNETKIHNEFTSYTINKGESISLCVRTRDSDDKLYNDNILFGVILHELAHVGSVGIDHGDEFKKNFIFLLKKASEWKMFERITEPFDYCGIETVI